MICGPRRCANTSPGPNRNRSFGDQVLANSIIAKRGVYAITCREDGRCYVGGSINIPHRWCVHRSHLRLKKHHSGDLQEAWDRLGADAFEFTVVESLPDGDLAAAEQRWMDRLQAVSMGYNNAPFASRTRGVVHTPETRAKVAAALTARYADPAERERMRKINVARLSDPAERRRLSAALKGVNRGEKHGATKLTTAGVIDIRRRSALGETQRAIAALYGISREAVSRIVTRTNWAHVP